MDLKGHCHENHFKNTRVHVLIMYLVYNSWIFVVSDLPYYQSCIISFSLFLQAFWQDAIKKQKLRAIFGADYAIKMGYYAINYANCAIFSSAILSIFY